MPEEWSVIREWPTVILERLGETGAARLTLNRPERRNALNPQLVEEFMAALEVVRADESLRAVVTRGNGPSYCSGLDLYFLREYSAAPPGDWDRPSPTVQFFHVLRDFPRVTIAQVHGDVYAAGLMLMWACDLIVAADDVTFADVVGTRLGMCGVEYLAHPWELGPRKTKELMLTGDSLSVDEAHALGMVSKVFPEAELSERTLEFARRIAQLPTMAALLIKESVNQTVDNMGFYNALQACFTLHELNHAHWATVHDDRMPGAKVGEDIPEWKGTPVRPSQKDTAAAEV